MISDKKLDFWIKNNLNVLFIGKHGVGKTTCVIDSFKRNNLKYLYFSASTMDPWVDFIGVPKEQKDENGNSYLELVRPKALQEDNIDAIFMDEYNRSNPKVRNAVMELIQFKSINGKKFNNLKFIWAAINPEDSEDSDDSIKYDVEKLDPAQKDRFQVHVEVPYKPSLLYFKNKYSDIGEYSCEWWNDLPANIKKEVSPRRLDYAIDLYKNNGDLRDVLPDKSNINKLISLLSNGSIKKVLEKLYKNKDPVAIAEFFKVENNYESAKDYVFNNKNYIVTFFPLFEKEKIASLLCNSIKIRKIVLESEISDKTVIDVVKDIVESNSNYKLVNKIKKSSFFKKYIYKVSSISSAKHIDTSTLNINNDIEMTFDKCMLKSNVISSSTFSSDLYTLSLDLNTTIGGTYHRRRILDFLSNTKPDVNTADICHTVLDTLKIIADRTQLNFSKDMFKSIVKIASFYVYELHSKFQQDLTSIFNKYNSKNMITGVLNVVVTNYRC